MDKDLELTLRTDLATAAHTLRQIAKRLRKLGEENLRLADAYDADADMWESNARAK